MCEVAFTANFSSDLVPTLGHAPTRSFKRSRICISNLSDLLSVAQILMNDDGTVYILGANDRGEEVIYRATPLHEHSSRRDCGRLPMGFAGSPVVDEKQASHEHRLMAEAAS